MLPSNSNAFCGSLAPWAALADLRHLLGQWFESFEVFLATGKNNLTSLGIRSYSAEKIRCAQGHGPWLCGYSVIQQKSHSKLSEHSDTAAGVVCGDLGFYIYSSPSRCCLFCFLTITCPLYLCICMQYEKKYFHEIKIYIYIYK